MPGEVRLEAKKHNHGFLYRAKIVPFQGPAEYGEWFSSESDLRSAMRETRRLLGHRYYCESKTLTCAECDVNEGPKVIAML
jgi:hypothetical protein